MSERRTITPPDIVEVDTPLIFLAGPIQGAPDWQSKAATIIHDSEPSIVVASPRKEYASGTFVYEKQVDWETYYLRQAGKSGVVAFWLANQITPTPERAYAQTSRFELAEWKMRHQYERVSLAVGIESGFGNERYIRRRFSQDNPDILIHTTLEALCHQAIAQATT